jgi:uncharacterized phiE125 gp8 family phage protein
MKDGEQDGRLSSCLATAISMLDGDNGELGHCLIAQTWMQSFAVVPRAGGWVRLSLRPVSQIASVEVRNQDHEWVEADLDVFSLVEDEGAFHVSAISWPQGFGRNPLRISFVAGFGVDATDVPEQIKQAILLLAAHFYEQREAVSTDRAPVIMPISIERLLSPFKIWVR